MKMNIGKAVSVHELRLPQTVVPKERVGSELVIAAKLMKPTRPSASPIHRPQASVMNITTMRRRDALDGSTISPPDQRSTGISSPSAAAARCDCVPPMRSTTRSSTSAMRKTRKPKAMKNCGIHMGTASRPWFSSL